MKRQRLLEEWNSYMAAAFADGRPHPVQLQETRRAFYAGARAIFSGDLTPSSGPEPTDLQMMAEFENDVAELAAFLEKVKTGEA